MGDIMIDIETLGVKQNAVILSIGAVHFNVENGEILGKIHLGVKPKSCYNLGLEIEYEAVMWWFSQSKDCQNELLSLINDEGVEISDALNALSSFILNCKPEQIWSNSPSFDLIKLKYVYEKVGKSLPWNFRNERCVRTIGSLMPNIKDKHIKNNTLVKHNALSDCLLQIGYVTEILNKLNIK